MVLVTRPDVKQCGCYHVPCASDICGGELTFKHGVLETHKSIDLFVASVKISGCEVTNVYAVSCGGYRRPLWLENERNYYETTSWISADSQNSRR